MRVSLVVLLLGACTANIPDGAYVCATDGDCPASFTCRVGLCYRHASEDAGTDATLTDVGVDAAGRDAGVDMAYHDASCASVRAGDLTYCGACVGIGCCSFWSSGSASCATECNSIGLACVGSWLRDDGGATVDAGVCYANFTPGGSCTDSIVGKLCACY